MYDLKKYMYHIRPILNEHYKSVQIKLNKIYFITCRANIKLSIIKK